MIKLQLPPKPLELDDATQQALTAEYKSTGKEVWRKEYIRTPLLEMSDSKCAYSEQKLGQESAYMEIEHFKHKSQYPDDVVQWGNLLPACKKSNISKGTTDVLQTPIVNPLVDNPREHLYVKSFRFYAKDPKGKNTIDVVALNDRMHFVTPRSGIGFKIADNLEVYYDSLKTKVALGLAVEVGSMLTKIKNLMRDCGSKEVYSAVLSTHLLFELPTYREMENFLRIHHLWDEEFEDIKRDLETCALPAPN